MERERVCMPEDMEKNQDSGLTSKLQISLHIIVIGRK